MQNFLLVGLGGFLGAMGRYGVALACRHAVAGPTLPLATLIVNLVGCCALGVVMGWGEGRDLWSTGARAFLVVGLLGGFTTFSAFGYEALHLIRQGAVPMALLHVLVQVGGGVLAVALGWVLGRAV